MYKAKNVNTDKALDFIDNARTRFERERHLKEREILSYYEGLYKGLEIAESIFLCENFEEEADSNA